MMDKVYIIGYTIDAMVEAVSQATQGKEVTFLATAGVGEQLDGYGDLVSGRSKDVLDTLLPGMLEYTRYDNPRFFWMPYDRVAIKNTQNGVIQYPLSRKSFCDDAEWKACADAFSDNKVQDVVNDKSAAPSKLVSALKAAMPQAFADTFCKAMQSTRWRGTQLSHLTMYGFEYEFPLGELGNESYNEYYYRPNHTFHEICAALSNVFAITVTPVDLNRAREYIVNRDVDGRVIIMDNRVDQLLDYVAGRFDRTRMWCVKEKVPPEIRYGRDGLYYTPLNTCWAVSVFGGKCLKFMSEPVTTLYDTFVSEIPSTRNNIRLHNQYCELVQRYGDKRLDLGQRVETLVKS